MDQIKKILVNYSFEGNQIKSVVADVVATDPVELTAGRFIYNSTQKVFKYCDGTSWVKAKVTATSEVADVENDTYAIYVSETDSELKFRGIKVADRDGEGETGKRLSIKLVDGAIVLDTTLNKKDVGLENVENKAQLRATQLSTSNTLTSLAENATEGTAEAQDGLVPSQKAVKTYIDREVARIDALIAGGVYYAGTWDGSKTIAENLTRLGIGTEDEPLRKGAMFKVNVAGNAGGIVSASNPQAGADGLNIGDQIICNKDFEDASTATGADFDVIDNTESADIVRVNQIQEVTNKTVDADNNTITNLEVDNFKDGVIVNDINALTEADDKTKKVVTAAAVAKAIEDYQDTTGSLSVQSFIKDVVTGESVVIPMTEHGCGKMPIVQVRQKNGTDWENVDTVVKVSEDGSVTIAWNGAISSNNMIKVMIQGVPE